jgi:hypothetical protein
VAGLFAGLVAIGVSVLIEKFGGIVGGTLGINFDSVNNLLFLTVLGASPTTIIPAGIGIALSRGHNSPAFIKAMFIVPLGMVMNGMVLKDPFGLPLLTLF